MWLWTRKFLDVDGAHVKNFVLYYANIYIMHWDGAERGYP